MGMEERGNRLKSIVSQARRRLLVHNLVDGLALLLPVIVALAAGFAILDQFVVHSPFINGLHLLCGVCEGLS